VVLYYQDIIFWTNLPVKPGYKVFFWTAAASPVQYEPHSQWKEKGILMLKRDYLTAVLVVLVARAACCADFQVNTRTAENQANPAIAMDADGNFVVVWSSYFRSVDRSNDILGQRFDPSFRSVGSEFPINTTTAGNQKEPSVAMDGMGNFVVAWQSEDGNDWDIFAQRFDANGAALGQEFGVNSFTDNKQRFPRVAISETGSFVIVWESEKLVAEPYAQTVAGQLYDANGLPVLNEFEANLLLQCRYPDVAMDAGGNFAVVWMQDKSTNSIIARLYNADGAPAMPFDVNSTSFNSITRPSVAMDNSGNFVVTWDAHPRLAGLDDVYARWYKFDGTEKSDQFLVNTTLDGAQQNPRIAMTRQREFAIVWHSKTGTDDNTKDIFAQRFNSFCTPIGRELRLNKYVPDDQKCPAVAISKTEKYIAVWQSDGQDGSGYGIFGTMVSKTCPPDFNGDGFINFPDYCILAEEWLTQSNLFRADLVVDNRVDALDLAEFCRSWLSFCSE